MNLIAKFTGLHARKEAASKPPFGAGFNAEIVAKLETLEVHGSDMKDAGGDYCEFRAFDASGTLLGTKKVKGY
ncbi:MAG: hypothetical protein ACOYM3_18235 [Terrimicrobiaceae bacterium]